MQEIQFTLGLGLAALGAGLAMGVAAIGSGIGVGIAGAAGAGVIAEDSKKFGPVLILQAFPQTQGIYGFVTAVLILMGVGLLGGEIKPISMELGVICLGAGLASALGGITAIGLDDFVPEPNVFGKGAISGFSGPAVKPIGLRFITEMAQCSDLKLPLVGCGGAETWIDAVEYLLCGASLVQITTGVIHYGHRIAEDICEGLSDFMVEKKYKNVSDIVGKALPNIHPTDAFNLSRQGVAAYDLDRCIGCGQCYIVCQDAGGQCIEWDNAKRKPIQDEKRCLSCMICSFICPIDTPPMITFKEIKNKKPVVPPVSI